MLTKFATEYYFDALDQWKLYPTIVNEDQESDLYNLLPSSIESKDLSDHTKGLVDGDEIKSFLLSEINNDNLAPFFTTKLAQKINRLKKINSLSDWEKVRVVVWRSQK